jgi:hypothetical protein
MAEDWDSPTAGAITGRVWKVKVKKNMAQNAASEVLAIQSENLARKYLTDFSLVEILTKVGPPTTSTPLADEYRNIYEYIRAIPMLKSPAITSETTETMAYCSIFTGRMMKRGEPIVAPSPIARSVANPYVGLGCVLDLGRENLTLTDSGSMVTRVTPEIRAARVAKISTVPEKNRVPPAK